MADKDTVARIVGYRHHRGADHVLVVWGDGTSSWTRLSSVSCRAQMLDFVGRGIASLRQKEEAETLAARKQKEAEMLQKLLAQNKAAPGGQASAPGQSSTIRALGLPENPPGVAQVGKFPCNDVKRGIRPLPEKYSAVPPKQRAPAADTKPAAPMPSDAARRATKPNVFSIYDSSRKLCEVAFYYKKGEAPINAEVGKMFFVPVRMVAVHIHNLHRQGGGVLWVGGADLQHDQGSPAFAEVKSVALQKGHIAVYTSGNICWMFDFSFRLGPMLWLAPQGDLIVLRVEDDPYLLGLAAFRMGAQKNMLWADNKYSAPAQRLTNFLFAGQRLPEGVPALFIGDSRTAIGRHIASLVKNGPGLASASSENHAIVIQGDYFDYIHQVRGIDALLARNIRFYGIQDFTVLEIMKAGGLFTVSERFLEGCDTMLISNFLSKLADVQEWGVRVPPAVYGRFKLKAAALHAKHKDAAALKRAYGLLKANCVEARELDYLSQLRKMFWKEYRYFYLIDSVSVPGRTISLSQADKLIGP